MWYESICNYKIWPMKINFYCYLRYKFRALMMKVLWNSPRAKLVSLKSRMQIRQLLKKLSLLLLMEKISKSKISNYFKKERNFPVLTPIFNHLIVHAFWQVILTAVFSHKGTFLYSLFFAKTCAFCCYFEKSLRRFIN